MERYRVEGGIFRVAACQVLRLSHAQIKTRAHKVRILVGDSEGATVEAEAPIEFKVGEEVGLPDLPQHPYLKLMPAQAAASYAAAEAGTEAVCIPT